MASVRLPISLAIMPIVDILVAGPANKKTNTAPGDKPAAKKPTATGVDAVAQIYMGIPTTAMTTIAIKPLPHCVNISVGTKVLITAAKAKPISNQTVMSLSNFPVENCQTSSHLLVGLVCVELQDGVLAWWLQQLLLAAGFVDGSCSALPKILTKIPA